MTSRPALFTVLALVLSLSVLAGCGSKPEQKPTGASIDPASAPATPVRTVTARRETVSDIVPITGSIAATQTVELAPKLSARVTFVAGREGATVRAGQVVLQQDTTDQINQVKANEATVRQSEAGVQQSRANLQTSQARLAQSRTQAKLQTTVSKSGVEDAEQQLRSSLAQLEIAKRPQRTQEITVAENAVTQAQANYDKAVLDRKRYEALVKEGAAAQAQLDQYATQERVALASLNTARAQLDIANTGGREESVRQAETAVARAQWGVRLAKANVQQNQVKADDIKAAEAAVAQSRASLAAAEASLAAARANLAQARQQVANATIVSPIDGVIAKRSAEEGQLIGPSASALTLVSLSTVFFEASVPETDVAKMRPAQTVAVKIDAYPGRAFTGRITKLYPTASTASRAFTIRVEIDNRSGMLRPGLFARGEVMVAQRAGIIIPKDAVVQTEEGEKAIFVAKDGKAERRLVKLGVMTAQTAEILSGVAAGDAVIVAGQDSLKDGASVRPADETKRTASIH